MSGVKRTASASFLQGAASILDQFQSSQGSKLPRVWQTVQPWLTRLLSTAPIKWLPILSQDSPCFILNPDGAGGWTECNQPAISLCDCCGKPTCLHHGRIDSSGGVICFPCVSIAHKVVREGRGTSTPPNGAPPKSAPRPAKPPEMSEAEAREVLQCDANATQAELRKAYKHLSKKYHTDSKVTANEPLFRKVQDARTVLNL